eukprot:364743-Chlamydomonas_euryale.AAC.28
MPRHVAPSTSVTIWPDSLCIPAILIHFRNQLKGLCYNLSRDCAGTEREDREAKEFACFQKAGGNECGAWRRRTTGDDVPTSGAADCVRALPTGAGALPQRSGMAAVSEAPWANESSAAAAAAAKSLGLPQLDTTATAPGVHEIVSASPSGNQRQSAAGSTVTHAACAVGC